MKQRASRKIFVPPWRDRGVDGSLGEWYGPKTAATFARQVTAFHDWSYRPPRSKSLRRDASSVRAFMRLGDGTLRAGVPDSEVKVYRMLYEDGQSVRHVARSLAVSRESVRSYLRRLRARAAAKIDRIDGIEPVDTV